MRAALFALGSAALCALAACGEQAARTRPPPRDPASLFAELNAVSREAAALKTPLAQYLFYRDRYQRSEGALHGFIGQVLAATSSELGAYEEAVLEFPQGAITLHTTPAALPEPARFEAVDAAVAIAELARERRIVIVNEAHHAAQTRVLTLALLPRLRALGFTHFAAEGLAEDDELAARGYPVRASGPYVAEPLYGEIVRTALRLGFRVVPYESAAKDLAARERGQARNLVERVFSVDPDARLFVHAGYAHVHKRDHYLQTDPMAMRLARATGLDPLVVDQTVLRPVAPGREYADYRGLVQAFPVATATLFRDRASGSPWSLEPLLYDASVLLPPTHLVHGRPDWLALGGERVEVAVAIDLQPSSLPCVVEARYAGESEAAVPADRVLVERGDGAIVLYLRPGDYRIVASTADGRAFARQRLRVDAPTAH
jgi:hypothetical protein